MTASTAAANTPMVVSTCAGILWRRCSPPTDTQGRLVPLGTILQVNHTEFPFPLVERAQGVQKLLLAMKSEITQLLRASLAPETVELLAVNLEGVAGSGIPAEHGVEDVIKVGQVQGVGHGHEPDDHRVDIAENRTQNQSLKGCCWHPPSLRGPPTLRCTPGYTRLPDGNLLLE